MRAQLPCTTLKRRGSRSSESSTMVPCVLFASDTPQIPSSAHLVILDGTPHCGGSNDQVGVDDYVWTLRTPPLDSRRHGPRRDCSGSGTLPARRPGRQHRRGECGCDWNAKNDADPEDMQAKRIVTVSHWRKTMAVEDELWLRNDGAS